MTDKTFRKVESLKDDEESYSYAAEVSYSRSYVSLQHYWDFDEAIALQDWLASATGYYPKEPKP